MIYDSLECNSCGVDLKFTAPFRKNGNWFCSSICSYKESDFENNSSEWYVSANDDWNSEYKEGLSKINPMPDSKASLDLSNSLKNEHDTP